MSELSSLYKNLAGSTSQDVTNTSSTVLESVLLLKKIADTDFSKQPELQELANAETKYIRAAAKAVSSDIMIQQLYGKDLEAVLKVSAIMKSREQEKEGMRVLDSYLANDDIASKRSSAEKAMDEIRAKATAGKFVRA